MTSNIIQDRESLTVEFKSDRRRLPDRELIEAVVCLANSEGGDLYLGVEDDGSTTGVHDAHRDCSGLPALISNRTAPALTVQVEPIETGDLLVLRIHVPKARQITATSDGIIKRRRLRPDGQPECVPFLPHEFASRESDLGLMDTSAQPVQGATLEDLDVLERIRLRRFIEQYNGDRALLALDDAGLDGALRLTLRTPSGERLPTLTGLLLLGREDALARLVPAHEIAFQVLDQEAVRLNEFLRAPLLAALERVETLFKPLNSETEFQDGLFRVPVPRLDPRAFREALANAVTHRDYARLGAVHLRLEDDTLSISNPGGLVEGVTLGNLLVTEPRPRNPALADAFKRIGLVERTGRGVDLIYRGLLRYGRHPPDYGRTDAHTVVVRLSLADADQDFLRFILEVEQKRSNSLSLDELIVLSLLRRHKRVNKAELAEQMQKDAVAVGLVLESLVESGLLQAHGSTKGRSYTLSPSVYQAMGNTAEYARQAGFDAIQQEQMVRTYVREHGRIRRQDVVELCRLTPDQAYKLLRRLHDAQVIEKKGDKKASYYVPGAKI